MSEMEKSCMTAKSNCWWRVLALLGAALTSSLLGVSTARADMNGGQCANGYHVIDAACQNRGSTDLYEGAYAEWDAVNEYVNPYATDPPPPNAFILNDLWLYTNNYTEGALFTEVYTMYGPGYNCGGCYQLAGGTSLTQVVTSIYTSSVMRAQIPRITVTKFKETQTI